MENIYRSGPYTVHVMRYLSFDICKGGIMNVISTLCMLGNFACSMLSAIYFKMKKEKFRQTMIKTHDTNHYFIIQITFL